MNTKLGNTKRVQVSLQARDCCLDCSTQNNGVSSGTLHE